ncbi:MAG TPA: winged helix-turn-helix domain-containing protein [Candidatus Acidoferrum sp.]|nr:winged helix-turn-helix domain-containing protein [Candidatus Acidoferrum sp.]
MKVFGDFEFDEQSTQLRRAGSPVPINGQCLDLLVLMLDRPGQVIAREEIRAALWPDSNVDYEHSLDVLVNRLRIALGDSGERPRYIQTVRKKGYRFVEEIKSTSNRHGMIAANNRARAIGRYVSVALLGALLALLFAHSRYQKFVPSPQAATPASHK